MLQFHLECIFHLISRNVKVKQILRVDLYLCETWSFMAEKNMNSEDRGKYL